MNEKEIAALLLTACVLSAARWVPYWLKTRWITSLIFEACYSSEWKAHLYRYALEKPETKKLIEHLIARLKRRGLLEECEGASSTSFSGQGPPGYRLTPKGKRVYASRSLLFTEKVLMHRVIGMSRGSLLLGVVAVALLLSANSSMTAVAIIAGLYLMTAYTLLNTARTNGQLSEDPDVLRVCTTRSKLALLLLPWRSLVRDAENPKG